MDGANAEEARFVEALERARVRLFRFLRRVTRDYHLAQDLTQETFLRALRAHREGAEPGSLYGWLFCVGYRAAIDRKRRRRPPEPMGRLDDRPAPGGDPEGHPTDRLRIGGVVVSRERALAEVREAIGVLPLNYRDLIRAHYEEGLSCREAGELLGIRRDNAKVRLLRGRRWIARRLRERLVLPNGGRVDGRPLSSRGGADDEAGKRQEKPCETVG
jgi:RNA polymerase sigma-70 factor (ECF subfamily)